MREQQPGAAASPPAGIGHAMALGGCSACPPPHFATAPIILMPRSSVFSAELRHVCLGDVLHTRSLKAMWVKASAFQRAGGSLLFIGITVDIWLALQPHKHTGMTAGTGDHSGSLESPPSDTTATAEKALCIQPQPHVLPQTRDTLCGGITAYNPLRTANGLLLAQPTQAFRASRGFADSRLKSILVTHCH